MQFRSNPNAVNQAQMFADGIPYPSEGFPDLYTLPPIDQGGRYSPLHQISARVYSEIHKHPHKPYSTIIQEFRTPTTTHNLNRRPETIYHIEYDREEDDGWIFLQLPGSPYPVLNNNNPFKTWQWTFSIMILPIRPIYNVISLQGKQGIQTLTSLERVTRNVLSDPICRQRMIQDIGETQRSKTNTQFPDLDDPIRIQLLNDLERDTMHQRDSGLHLIDGLEFYHYPFPLCELSQMHPKIGYHPSEAFSIHAKRVISNHRFIMALKIIDNLPLTIKERKEAHLDWVKYHGGKQPRLRQLLGFSPLGRKKKIEVLKSNNNNPTDLNADGYRERIAPLGII